MVSFIAILDTGLEKQAQKIEALFTYCNQLIALRTESTPRQPALCKQCIQTGSTVSIPHLECVVSGGRDDIVAIWTHRTASHVISMAAQGEPLDSTVSIPHLECVVSGGRDDIVPTGTDGTLFNNTGMSMQGESLSS